jgi:hypothetical protein
MQDAGSLLQHDHVTEPRGDNAHRRYHRRGLRRTYDWNTRSHFYPDIVDQIQDDCVFDDGVDDDDDISRCGKFYRWESGRHRNSGRRKYPRWSLCVRRLTNNHVAPASTVIHENPDIVNADKQQHCNNNYNDSHTGSISGTVSRTKAIRTPQYFRRLHYVSSSLNEKIGRKESSVGLQFGTNRKPSRRLSDSGLESAKLQAAVDDGKARVCTDRLSRDEGQTNAENKLEVVNEHAVVVRTRRRVRQSKADECRQLSNKLTSLLNTGSKTRRQFVRKRCRRLIGWDPYGGFGSEQTESTPTSTCCSGGGSADDEDDVTQGRKTEMQEKIDNSLQTGDDNSPIEPIAVDRILTTTSADGDCHDDAASRPHQNVFDYPQPCDDEPSQCHRHNENETNTSDGDSSRREAHTPDVLHIGGGVETPSSNIDAEHETRNTLITGPRRLWDEMRSRERIIGTDHRPPGHDYDYVLYKISNNLRQHTTAEFSNHSPNTRRSLDNVVRKGHRAHERRRLRSCANSSAEDAKVQNSNKGSDSERADQLHIDGDRLSSNGRCMNWRTFDRFTDQISNLVNDGTEAVDCRQIVDRHIDDDDAAAAAAADDDAEKNFINGSLIHSGLTSPTFKCDGHRFTEDVGDNQQVSDYAHFEGDFEINETRDDRLKASAIYPSDDNSLGNLSLSTRDWNESPAFSCGMSKRRCVERIVPDDCHQRRYPDCQAHDRREQKLKPGEYFLCRHLAIVDDENSTPCHCSFSMYLEKKCIYT